MVQKPTCEIDRGNPHQATHVCNTRNTSTAARHQLTDGESADDCVAVVGVDDLGSSDEWVDLDPEEGEDGGEEDGPEHHDGGRAVLAAHETLEERVQVHDHPHGEEHLAKERAPGLIAAVERGREASHHAHQVEHQDAGGRDQHRRPLEHVQLPELGVVRGLRRDCEVGVQPGNHLENTLEHGEQVGGHASDDPELLIAPPVLNPDATPPQLQHGRQDDGHEEAKKPYRCSVGQLKERTANEHCGHMNYGARCTC